MSMTINQIKLRPSKIVRALGGTAFLLVLASIVGQLTKYLLGHDTVYGLIRLSSIDEECNIPSYFSASLLLLAALLLALITALKKTSQAAYGFQWAIFSFTFLYMAVDEAASIHELLSRPTLELLRQHASGIFYVAWVIPGITLVIVFVLSYLKFFLHLPAKTRVLFFVAVTMYLGGAIGMVWRSSGAATWNCME